MKRIICILLFIPWISFSQVLKREGLPLSKKLAKKSQYLRPVPKYSLPYMNSDFLRAVADTLNDYKVYFGYGRTIKVPYSYGVEDTVFYEEYSDSAYIWRVRVASPGAYKTYIQLDSFYLPKFSELYIYSPFSNKPPFKFTYESNNAQQRIIVGPLEGSEVILEYNASLHIEEKPKIQVKKLVHQFITELQNYAKTQNNDYGFGTSDTCHKNIMCKDPNWCNERRAVVLLKEFETAVGDSFTSFCTASLIVNERRDGRPYLLTAFHCFDKNLNATLETAEKGLSQGILIVFNYQSPTCANPINEPLQQYIIHGSDFRAAYVITDFALLELSTRPPGNFNAYYAGWDRTDFKGKNRPKNVVGIHHPRGDIKKIALSKKKIKRRKNKRYGYGLIPNAPKMKIWRVKWTEGGTEVVASGSPLFYRDKQYGFVIGQLSGDNRNFCNNNSVSYYGRFSTSWSEGGTKYSRLREWLNPNYTQVNLERMSGEDPCKPSYYFENANDLHTSDNVVGTFVNPPGPFPGQRSYDGKYLARDSIVAGNNVEILPGTSVEFFAQRIRLKQGFHAKAGSHFLARIEPCIGGCQDASLINFRQGGAPVAGIPSAVQEAQAREIVVVNNADASFRFYPNPTTGISYVELPSTTIYEVSVRDLLGREILRKSNLQGRTELNLSGFPKGIYFLQVQTEQGEFFREKVILE